MKLFSEDLGSVETDEELASLQKQFPAYDPGYICQSTAKQRRKTKAWMESLWVKYEHFADSNFVEEFKRHFVERSWELSLGATLLNRRLVLNKHNDEGPDFEVLNPIVGSRIAWIEAVVATKGDGPDRVPDRVHEVVRPVPVDEMQLRLSASLDAKFKKYQSYIEDGIVDENDPYVIAIDRSSLDSVDPMMPMILKVLFGIGDLTLNFSLGGDSKDKNNSWSAKHFVRKNNGKDISMLFFENENHTGISAVIYSMRGILNCPRIPEEMGEDLVIVHNHKAKNPLSENFPPFGSEYKVVGEYIKNTRERKRWQHQDFFE